MRAVHVDLRVLHLSGLLAVSYARLLFHGVVCVLHRLLGDGEVNSGAWMSDYHVPLDNVPGSDEQVRHTSSTVSNKTVP